MRLCHYHLSLLDKKKVFASFQTCTTTTDVEKRTPQPTGGILAKAVNRIKLSSLTPKSQPARGCFHPGAGSLAREHLSVGKAQPITGRQMISAMLTYIWPADDSAVRKRVTVAVGLLISAKLLNVAVPFMFKYGVDTLNAGSALNMTTPSDTVLTVATSLLLGCKK